ncbi:MAG: hypothetical protein LBB14_02600 [Puniceicoccales bacterium]|nr:hypothetical protein [Puniceicoccales bacterium]
MWVDASKYLRAFCALAAFYVLPGAAFGANTIPVDDYDNVQLAVDAAEDGDCLKFSEKTYTFSNQVVVPSESSHLVFLGADLSDADKPLTILKKNEASHCRFFNFAGSAESEISAIAFSGNGADAGSGSNGGAIHVTSNFAGTVANCTFESNSTVNGCTGGAIYCITLAGKLESSQFTGNRADRGGAVYCLESFAGTVANCTFESNWVTGVDCYGGAIYCITLAGNLESSQFVGNSTDERGGALYCHYSPETSTLLHSCTFEGNRAQHGGAIYFLEGFAGTVADCKFESNLVSQSGGAIYFRSLSGTLESSQFWGNSADYGGAIYCNELSGTGILRNCAFGGNWADSDGGTIYCGTLSGTIQSCTFESSWANNSGGAIYCGTLASDLESFLFTGNSAGNSGGAIACQFFSESAIRDCTFEGNSAADYGGAIYCQSLVGTVADCKFESNW